MISGPPSAVWAPGLRRAGLVDRHFNHILGSLDERLRWAWSRSPRRTTAAPDRPPPEGVVLPCSKARCDQRSPQDMSSLLKNAFTIARHNPMYMAEAASGCAVCGAGGGCRRGRSQRCRHEPGGTSRYDGGPGVCHPSLSAQGRLTGFTTQLGEAKPCPTRTPGHHPASTRSGGQW